MEKTEICAVIKYLHLKGMTASEIHNGLLRTLAESAPSYATVTRIREFKRGRDSVEDDQRSGQPLTATTKDNLEHALQMVMQDRQIAERLRMSIDRAHKIFTKELGFSKVSARWVPRREAMVRTRADVGSTRVAGAKAPRKSLGSTSSVSSPSGSTSKNKYAGGNSHNPQPIPSWQKSIGAFLTAAPKEKPSSSKDENSDDGSVDAQSSTSSSKDGIVSDND